MERTQPQPNTRDFVRKGSGINPESAGFAPKIYVICLTGGPCAGKTTACSLLKEKLSSKFILYFLPELAATTVLAGVTIIPSEFTPKTHTVFTEGIMKMQMEMEDYFYKIATIQKKDVIIITDRGCIDNLAYCSSEVKEEVLTRNGWTLEKIRDERYDAVIHLVTAADGAEEFYTLANNHARTETPEVARWIDKRTQSVWTGHPFFTVVDNRRVRSFQEKMDEVYKCICKVISIPEEPSYVRKFLIEGIFDLNSIPQELAHEEFTEVFNYLPSEDDTKEQIWVKKRISQATNRCTYSLTRRRIAKDPSQRLELMRTITSRQYEEYLKITDKNKFPISKDVVVLVVDNHYYHIETLKVAGNKVSILRAFVVGANEQNKLPKFITVVKEVTEDLEYFTYNMASGPHGHGKAQAHEAEAKEAKTPTTPTSSEPKVQEAAPKEQPAK